jgi:hypothetical protein
MNLLALLYRLYRGIPAHAERANALPPITKGKVANITGPSRYPADVPGFIVSPAELAALTRWHDGERSPDDRDLIDAMLDRHLAQRVAR